VEIGTQPDQAAFARGDEVPLIIEATVDGLLPLE
jgi:hypothetical protein